MLDQVIQNDDFILMLTAGLLFCLIWLSASHIVALLKLILERRATPRALRLRYWPGWATVGRFVGLSLALGYLFFLLRIGVFVASDVGLGHIDPRAAWSDPERTRGWILLALPSVFLLTMLWVPLWHAHRADRAQDTPPQAWSEVVADALGYEVVLAILRGSLMPLVGVYWGAWLAVLIKMALMLILPRVRHSLGQRDGRTFVYLQWALDWQSAMLFTLYGDMTITFAARLGATVFLYALYRGLARPRRRRQGVSRRS